MTGFIESIKKELREVKQEFATSKRPGDIAQEWMEGFHVEKDSIKNPLIERFYIRTYGRYEPVEIRYRLHRGHPIVEIYTGSHSRDKRIANFVFNVILMEYSKEEE